MNKGTQIAYVPSHVVRVDGGGALVWQTHPDVQFGFVTSSNSPDTHFCRYWLKKRSTELRTKANSERTPNDCLVEWESVPQILVEQTIRLIEGEADV